MADQIVERNVIDLHSFEIPADRTVSTKFDIPLEENDFLLDAGHTNEFNSTGSLDPNKLYKVQTESGQYGGIWSKVSLDTFLTSNAYLSNKDVLLEKLIYAFRQQVGQYHIKSEMMSIESVKRKLEDPSLKEAERKAGESYLTRNLPRVEKIQHFQEHQAKAAKTFLDRVAESQVDLTKIPQYEETMQVINNTLSPEEEN